MSTPYSKDVKLDPGTFGASPACHVLVDMMNKNFIAIGDKHKVLSFVNDANTQMKWISTISYKPAMERALSLLREDLITRASQMPYEAKFKTYLKNVICYFYKKTLRTWNESKLDNRKK